MTEYKTFDDYVKNTFNLEPRELTHISPEEQKKKTVAITVDELVNIWNELTELKLKAGKPKWHKVTDGDLPKGEKYGRDGVHRDIYLRDRYGKIYTGNYFPKDENHEEDCFAVEILDWGFRGSQFCKKKQISDWCEIPKYTEE